MSGPALSEQRILAAIEVIEAGPVRIIAFRRAAGETVPMETVRAYFGSVMLAHTSGWNRLVLDLSGVQAIDSAALGPLVQKLREVQEARGRVVLTGVEAAALREIFALTRFDRVFPIMPTRELALAEAAR
jgi:anti-anti-sigma factor